MDFRAITRESFWMRPMQFEGTTMLPNILLMCKLLVILLLAHHFYFKIDDPFLPFIGALDYFNSIPGVFKVALRVVFVVSVLGLFFNYYVRTFALCLGSIVILSILASKPAFYNHTFICGCALFLAGLTNRTQAPWIFYLQMSLVYIGASVNKIHDLDWWSGAFMHNWLAIARENPVYLLISAWLPYLWFAKFLSWTAVSTEFLIGILLLLKKYRPFAVWFIIIFHTLLFTMTSFRFGHFIESLAIILLVFLNWPKSNLNVQIQPGTFNLFRRLITFMDLDQKIEWREAYLDTGTNIKVVYDEKEVVNDAAIKDLLLYSPAFYIIIIGIDMALYIILYNHRTTLFILNVLTLWPLIIYFLPISWSRFFKQNSIVDR